MLKTERFFNRMIFLEKIISASNLIGLALQIAIIIMKCCNIL